MKDSNIYIQRFLTIDSPTEGEKLWQFYEETFQGVNESSPITQTLPKATFIDWLSNEKVIKLIAMAGIEIKGLCFFTDQIHMDWLLSPAYFAKHYSDTRVFMVPVVAVTKSMRGLKVVNMLIEQMLEQLSYDNGMIVFLYSKVNNYVLPELCKRIAIKKYPQDKFDVREIDSEVCCVVTRL